MLINLHFDFLNFSSLRSNRRSSQSLTETDDSLANKEDGLLISKKGKETQKQGTKEKVDDKSGGKALKSLKTLNDVLQSSDDESSLAVEEKGNRKSRNKDKKQTETEKPQRNKSQRNKDFSEERSKGIVSFFYFFLIFFCSNVYQ